MLEQVKARPMFKYLRRRKALKAALAASETAAAAAIKAA